MSSWLIATAAGLVLAALLYGWREPAALVRAVPAAVLRALALVLVLALLLDAPAGRARTPNPLVALDVSQSWTRGGDSALWRAARSRALELAGDSVILFGDSARRAAVPAQPTDAASRAQPLIDRAVGLGRPVLLITDGELDDPASLRGLPAGSRLELSARPARRDLAVASVESPAAGVGGDTVELRVLVRSGNAAVPSAELGVRVGSGAATEVHLDSMAPDAERAVAVRLALPSVAGPNVLRAVVTAPGDAEPRNDSVAVPVDIARAAGAVLVSTSPDLDARYIVSVLRGAVALPTRAYYRVAPGQWRLEGALTPVAEADVRRALHDAPLAILHGDTSYFGNPRSAATGALALLSPPRDSTGEWYPVAAPPSPVATALSGIEWDSLPPLDLGGAPLAGDWTGLEVARARQFDRRAALVGSAVGRRVVVVGASGFWRWRVRGAESADAFDALWGSVLDWLSAERPDVRAAIPADGVMRAGERVRWRRGSGRDSVVIAILRRRGGPAREDSVMLRFGATGNVTESEPLAPGIYDVRVPGGAAVLAVNASRELVPRAPTVKAASLAGTAAAGDRPRLRDKGWAYLIILLALCAEWLLRRRLGLR